MITVSVPCAALSAVGGTETTIMTRRTDHEGGNFVIIAVERRPWPMKSLKVTGGIGARWKTAPPGRAWRRQMGLDDAHAPDPGSHDARARCSEANDAHAPRVRIVRGPRAAELAAMGLPLGLLPQATVIQNSRGRISPRRPRTTAAAMPS